MSLAEHLIVLHGIDPDTVFDWSDEERQGQHEVDHEMTEEEQHRLHGWFTPHKATSTSRRLPREDRLKRKWLDQYRRRVKGLRTADQP